MRCEIAPFIAPFIPSLAKDRLQHLLKIASPALGVTNWSRLALSFQRQSVLSSLPPASNQPRGFSEDPEKSEQENENSGRKRMGPNLKSSLHRTGHW